ncbi:protein MAIN-LIKE 1-like [Nicotiana tomentosiformis]|uniref:protein MAIN-LIKE 1-like n=1 Tax=Nicotiana tomentosiformis TaxID=4098 RepID=UPI00388C95E9
MAHYHDECFSQPRKLLVSLNMISFFSCFSSFLSHSASAPFGGDNQFLSMRWRLETHTFHPPIGEATITLEDVDVLFGLPVEGLPVAYPHALRDYRGLHYLQMLQRLTRFQPAEETALSEASRLQLTPVRQHQEAMDVEIMDDSPPEVIDRHTRLVLLLMFGGVLFPNTSGNLVSLRFQHHLEWLDDLPGYSWGAAVLGYMYRQT